MELLIGTLNIKNNLINRVGGQDGLGNDNAQKLSSYLNKHNYDILGTQELTRRLSHRLTNEFNIKLYGNYRYGQSNFIKSIKFFDDYNENNAIMTNLNVIDSTTKRLPWIARNPIGFTSSLVHASIMPRILTGILINDPKVGEIYALNTHLDYQVKSIQKRQLKYILETVKNINHNYQVVLTGDFNMEVGTPYFDDFILELEKLGLQRVPVNNKTNELKYENKTSVDHIFIPNKWLIKDQGLIEGNELNPVTSHKGVYVKTIL